MHDRTHPPPATPHLIECFYMLEDAIKQKKLDVNSYIYMYMDICRTEWPAERRNKSHFWKRKDHKCRLRQNVWNFQEHYHKWFIRSDWKRFDKESWDGTGKLLCANNLIVQLLYLSQVDYKQILQNLYDLCTSVVNGQYVFIHGVKMRLDLWITKITPRCLILLLCGGYGVSTSKQ